MLEYSHSKIINLQAVHCYTSETHCLLQRRQSKTLKSDPLFLKINRKDSSMEQVTLAQISRQKNQQKRSPQKNYLSSAQTERINNSALQVVYVSQDKQSSKHSLKGYSKRSFSAFLGIIIIQKFQFLLFADQAKVVSSIDGIQIFEISSLFFMPLKQERQIRKQQHRNAVFQKIRQLSSILNFGFYFSFSHNLTRSLQYQLLQNDQKFIWNKKFEQPLGNFKKWHTPIIQGFASSFQIILQGCKLQYILISRRSNYKGGPRYFDRGINDQGHVANFVQTQQIIKIKDYLISDVQIRGNAPLFFQQKGLTTKVRITRGTELTHQIFKKHVKMLIHYYLRVFMVNLLCKSKEDQLLIIQQFEKHVRIESDPQKNQNKSLQNQMKYFYLDFHQRVQGSNFQNIDDAVNLVAPIKRNFGHYIVEGKKVIQRPAGVFRTNCLDCLDRTNFFQAKMALVSLQQILGLFNISFQKDLITIMNDPLDQRALIKNFRNIWADNGDTISYHYTGTGSTHTDITRDGKRGWLGGFKHKYKSVTRFYNQNFFDFYKMRLVDMLLGTQQAQSSKPTQAEIPKYMMIREGQFCQKVSAEVYIFTWKVPKNAPPFLPFFPISAKIIAVGLQQVQNIQVWKKLLSQSINLQKYNLVAQKNSNKNYLSVYAHKEIIKQIRNVQLTKVKFKSYYNTYFSTKCAVLIRLTLYSTRIVFINCQLQYGRDFFQNRISNLKELHEYAFQQEVVGQKKSHSINQDDTVFLFGNTNCTIQSSENKAYFQQLQKIQSTQRSKNSDKVVAGHLSESKIPQRERSFNSNLDKERVIRKLLQSDDFQYLREILMQYRYYDEEQIKFSPTYLKTNGKYNPEKSGWPDRIWISSQNEFSCSNYGIVQGIKGQKHFPVSANYLISCDKIDQNARQTVFRDIAVSMVGIGDQQLKEKQQPEIN